MSEVTLAVTELYAGYDGALVLRGVSMVARGDEIVSIIGPNGAGSRRSSRRSPGSSALRAALSSSAETTSPRSAT